MEQLVIRGISSSSSSLGSFFIRDSDHRKWVEFSNWGMPGPMIKKASMGSSTSFFIGLAISLCLWLFPNTTSAEAAGLQDAVKMWVFPAHAPSSCVQGAGSAPHTSLHWLYPCCTPASWGMCARDSDFITKKGSESCTQWSQQQVLLTSAP